MTLSLQDYFTGLNYLSSFFVLLFLSRFSRDVRSVPQEECDRRTFLALTYHLYVISYSFILFQFVVSWSPANYPPGALFPLFMFWLVNNVFWCPLRNYVARGRFLLKVRLFVVRFMCWCWKLDGYAVLVCCVIRTLQFSIFQHKSKHNNYFARNLGSQDHWKGLHTRYWDMPNPPKDGDFRNRRTGGSVWSIL